MRTWIGPIIVQANDSGMDSTLRRLAEMDYVDKMFQFGIRGISSSKKEDVDAAREYGMTPGSETVLVLEPGIFYFPIGIEKND